MGGPIAERVRVVKFVRGFPEWIEADATVFAREWQDLVRLAPIRHLDVVHAKTADALTALFACPALAQIITLSFNVIGPRFGPPDGTLVTPLVESPHLGKLRVLDLRCCPLTSDQKARIAHATNMPALECLQVDDLTESVGMDYDGSIQTVYPSEELAAFETQYGKARALHYTERTERTVTRDYF